MDMAVEIFSLTDNLPRKEDFGLTSQLRRSALSVSGNLAEGFGRKHTKEKLNFYYHARASLTETKSHLIYGKRVQYFTEKEFSHNVLPLEQIWKEINSLIVSMEKRS